MVVVVNSEAPAASGEIIDPLDPVYLAELTKLFAKWPRYTAESLRTDRELIFRVVKEHKEGWRLIKYASEAIKADRELIVWAIRSSAMGWKALGQSSYELRNDMEVCLEAVRRNAAALELVAPEMKRHAALESEALATLSRKMNPKTHQTREDQVTTEWERVNKSAAAQKVDLNPGGEGKRHSTLPQEEQSWSDRLQQEIDYGKRRSLMGTFTRVVPLTCLRLLKQDGYMLVALGSLEQGGKLTVEAKLPGLKLKDGEHPRETLSRLMDTKLGQIAKNVQVRKDFDVVVEDHKSATVNQETRYLRSIYSGKLNEKYAWSKDVRFVPSSAFRRSSQRSMHITSLGKRFGRMPGAPPSPPDIFVFSFDEKKIDYMAWIACWEYDWLRYVDSGKQTLAQWMDSIDLTFRESPGELRLNLQLSLNSPRAGSEFPLPPLSTRSEPAMTKNRLLSVRSPQAEDQKGKLPPVTSPPAKVVSLGYGSPTKTPRAGTHADASAPADRLS
eukprot:TRINITY_DN22831_c0_g1_i1.p1 TRINITY_DN22831_c0_g1~~TRINITY_DN22831_c0_g1_i1.p1  ORF type:complete len:500 (+),score=82.09 TRINITY_DN22831_c0_g1_i1:99-1598(+)